MGLVYIEIKTTGITARYFMLFFKFSDKYKSATNWKLCVYIETGKSKYLLCKMFLLLFF